MKRTIKTVAAFMIASSVLFTSCVKNEVSDQVEALRAAQVEAVNAQTALTDANAAYTNAQAVTQAAIAAYNEALAAVQNANAANIIQGTAGLVMTQAHQAEVNAINLANMVRAAALAEAQQLANLKAAELALQVQVDLLAEYIAEHAQEHNAELAMEYLGTYEDEMAIVNAKSEELINKLSDKAIKELTLEGEMLTNETALTLANNDLDRANIELAALQTTLATYESAIDNPENIQAEVDAINVEIVAQEALKAEAKLETVALEIALENAEADFNEANADIDVFEGFQDDVDAIQDDIDDISADVLDLTDDIATLTAENVLLETEKAALTVLMDANDAAVAAAQVIIDNYDNLADDVKVFGNQNMSELNALYNAMLDAEDLMDIADLAVASDMADVDAARADWLLLSTTPGPGAREDDTTPEYIAYDEALEALTGFTAGGGIGNDYLSFVEGDMTDGVMDNPYGNDYSGGSESSLDLAADAQAFYNSEMNAYQNAQNLNNEDMFDADGELYNAAYEAYMRWQEGMDAMNPNNADDVLDVAALLAEWDAATAAYDVAYLDVENQAGVPARIAELDIEELNLEKYGYRDAYGYDWDEEWLTDEEGDEYGDDTEGLLGDYLSAMSDISDNEDTIADAEDDILTAEEDLPELLEDLAEAQVQADAAQPAYDAAMAIIGDLIDAKNLASIEYDAAALKEARFDAIIGALEDARDLLSDDGGFLEVVQDAINDVKDAIDDKLEDISDIEADIIAIGSENGGAMWLEAQLEILALEISQLETEIAVHQTLADEAKALLDAILAG